MASDPQTWTELKASMAEWLNRSDLTAKIPEFIALAERRFDRILTVPEREETSTATTVASSNLALPTDFWAMRALYLTADPKVRLEPISPNELRIRYSSNVTGQPQVYSIISGEIVFGPAPDAAYAIQSDYIQTIPKLGASQATNWLLTAHPDIYLWSSLIMAEAYMVNDERIALWKGAADEAIGELITAGGRKRYASAPLRMRNPVRGSV